MDATTVTPRYIPIVQKPKCCAVACLQMVLYRNGFGLYDQEDLAIEFGVKIGEDDRDAFREDMPVLTKFNHDEGISTLDSVDHINDFFKKNGLKFKAVRHDYDSVPSVSEAIFKQLSAGNDVWIEYHSQEISKSDRIHDALVESIDLKTRMATLIDPKPTRRQRISIPVDMLDRSMSDFLGRKLGFLSLEKIS